VITHRAVVPEPSPVTDADEPVDPSGRDTDDRGGGLVVSSDYPQSADQPDTRQVLRTRERYAAVQKQLAEGRSISAISRTLRLDRHIVRRFARATDLDELPAKATNPHHAAGRLPALPAPAVQRRPHRRGRPYREIRA
jgi:hypothetical protein